MDRDHIFLASVHCIKSWQKKDAFIINEPHCTCHAIDVVAILVLFGDCIFPCIKKKKLRLPSAQNARIMQEDECSDCNSDVDAYYYLCICVDDGPLFTPLPMQTQNDLNEVSVNLDTVNSDQGAIVLPQRQSAQSLWCSIRHSANFIRFGCNVCPGSKCIDGAASTHW